MFKENNKNGIKYFTSTKLGNLQHSFSTRGLDMKSEQDRRQFLSVLGFMPKSLSFEQEFLPEGEEDFDAVEKNRGEGFNLIMPHQEHTNNIAIVEHPWEVNKDFYATDGIIITIPNVPVLLCFADCVPVILYSKKDNILAVLHAGWRGTAAGIVKKCCKILIDEMGLSPQNISMAIGACISGCCFEVSKDVKEALEYSLDGEYHDVFVDNTVDLKKINAYQAIESGIMDIDVMEYCTSCHNDLFYSYRRENQTPLRHGVVAQLTEDLG